MAEGSGWTGTVKGMPKEGAAAERSRRVGMREIELFTAITGDRNPLHYDRALAEQSLFRGLIVVRDPTDQLATVVEQPAGN